MKNDIIAKTLSNGIKVYIYKDDRLKRFHASYSVNYGSNGYFHKFYYDGKPYHVKPGIAHFIEHLLLETSTYGNMIYRYKDRNYETNGITSGLVTTYFFRGIDDEKDLDTSLEELISMIENPQLTEENVEKVKNAICDEVRSNHDSKTLIALNNDHHNLYKNYDPVPIDNCSIGNVETTKAITLEEVKACYDAYYNDENKFIVVGGNIDIDKTMDKLEKIFAKYKPHPNKLKAFDYGEDFGVRKELEVINLPGDIDYVVTSYKIRNETGITDKLKLRYYIYRYLSLKFSQETPFIKRLLKEKKITGNILTFTEVYDSHIVIGFQYKSYDPKGAIRDIDNELNLENLDREEFDLINKTSIAGSIERYDHIYYFLQRIPFDIDVTYKINDIDTVRSLNFDEMINVISKLKFDLKTTTVVTNKKELEDESL